MLEFYVIDFVVICYDMDFLVLKYLGYKNISFQDIVGKGVKQFIFNQVGFDEVGFYVFEDVDIILCLYQIFWLCLEKEVGLKSVFYDIEILLVLVFSCIECNGIYVDVEMFKKQSIFFVKCMLELEEKVFEEVGQKFNFGLFKQFGEIFYEKLEILVIKKIFKGVLFIVEVVFQDLVL